MKLSKETIDRLQERFIADLGKPDISILDKAIMIDNYLKAKTISMRELSKQSNIPLTNLHEWLLPLKLKPDKREKITTSSKMADVYELIGKGRTKNKSYEYLDDIIDIFIQRMEKYKDYEIKNPVLAKDRIIRLKNMLGDILSKI